MNFKVGDSVSVLDDNLSGTIKKIIDNKIIVESSDGFEMEFEASELIKNQSDVSLHNEAFRNASADEILKEKEIYNKKTQKTFKPKKQSEHALEVDLHIDKLIDSTKGMTNFDMLNLQLDTARGQLEFAIRKRIQRVVFIHGIGEGVLKMELESLCRRYDNLKYYQANPRKYGIGAMEVYIPQSANS